MTRSTTIASSIIFSTAAILLSTASHAQQVTPLIPLSDFCVLQSGSFCQTPEIGTRTLTEIAPVVIGTDPVTGFTTIKGAQAVTFDGRLQVDGVAITSRGVYPSLLLPNLNNQIDVEVATQFDANFDLSIAQGEVIANPGFNFVVNSLTTKSIGVDIRSDSYDFGDGTFGKLRLASLDPSNVVDNATAVAGSFSSTDGKILFGRITGNARLESAPGPVTLPFGDGTPNQYLSPFALAMDVQTEVLTQLDENGLVTPTVTVTDGIEMSGSRITGLGAGVDAGDAVNMAQLQQESSARAALGDALLDETRARVAGDLALGNQLNALDGRVSTLQSRVDKLDNKIASSTAVAVAMGGGVFLPGMKFNLTANVGTYDGAHAGSVQFGALVSKHVAVNAGVATGFNKGGKTAGRVGFTFGW